MISGQLDREDIQQKTHQLLRVEPGQNVYETARVTKFKMAKACKGDG